MEGNSALSLDRRLVILQKITNFSV